MTPYVLLHNSVPFGAPPGCGKPAYYLRRKIEAGAPFRSADGIELDGMSVTAGGSRAVRQLRRPGAPADQGHPPGDPQGALGVDVAHVPPTPGAVMTIIRPKHGEPIEWGRPAKKKAPVTKPSRSVTKVAKKKRPKPKPKGPAIGRPRIYEDRAHRQRAYRERKANA